MVRDATLRVAPHHEAGMRRGARSRPIHLSNSHAKSSAAYLGPAAGRRVSALAGGPWSPRKAEGAERRLALRVVRCTPWRGVPADLSAGCPGRARPLGEGNAAPFGAPRGVFLTATGSHFRCRRVSSIGAGRGLHGSDGSLGGHSAPGSIPVRPGPRACEARRRRRRTPLRLRSLPEAPSSERGCTNICFANVVAATANST